MLADLSMAFLAFSSSAVIRILPSLILMLAAFVTAVRVFSLRLLSSIFPLASMEIPAFVSTPMAVPLVPSVNASSVIFPLSIRKRVFDVSAFSAVDARLTSAVILSFATVSWLCSV